MKKLLNYIGQLRIYSLIDLILLLIASGATKQEFIGIIFLHIGFLALLESQHKHNGREKIPKWLWMPLVIVGAGFYQHLLEAALFLVCSFLYSKKNRYGCGTLSPFFRGMQYFALFFGITHSDWLPWIACFVMIIRNSIGDWRDIEKDKRRGMNTIPMLLGAKKDLRYGHLIAMFVSSTIWWNYTNISVWVLLGVILVEVATYNLTPR